MDYLDEAEAARLVREKVRKERKIRGPILFHHKANRLSATCIMLYTVTPRGWCFTVWADGTVKGHLKNAHGN